MKFDFHLSSDENIPSPMGLIVLQVDETIEGEFREAFGTSKNQIFVTRIPSGLEVTAETLTSMEQHIGVCKAITTIKGIFCHWVWMYISKCYYWIRKNFRIN